MRKLCFLLFPLLAAGHVCAQEVLQSWYLLENDIVHAYLNDFTYDTIPDVNVSYVLDYYNRPHDYRLDAPKPVTLSWTKAADARSQRIEVSESPDFSDALVYQVGNKDSYDVYNLIPGRQYYYRVISTDAASNEKTVASGQFMTEGRIRMILAEGTWNVRDMGGWISKLNGQPIAYGKLFRGGKLRQDSSGDTLLTAQGIEAMRNVGIRAEMDLRSEDNVPSGKRSSALAKKDAQGNLDVDFVLMSKSVSARMWKFDANTSNIEEMQWVINELKKNKPVYFHCQNGADRTGTLGFLIGALLGMSDNDLLKDYELTTFCAPYTKEEGFARIRYSTEKLGSPDASSDPNDYTFAPIMDKLKSMPGETTQEKIYKFFLNGVDNKSISPADLSWFIREMTGHIIVGGMEVDVDTLYLESGVTHQLIVTPQPAEAIIKELTFETSNESIATVSEEGLVTATGGGSAMITVTIDGIISKVIPVVVPITTDNIPQMCIENDVVHRYMTEVHYDGADYSVSLIGKYDTITTRYDKDRPENAVIRWVTGKDVVSQSLTVSKNEDFSDFIVNQSLDGSTKSYMVKELDPQSIYYYNVYKLDSYNKGMLSTSSAILTTGTVKMVKADGTYNVRDLGGWTGLNGKMVKYGKIMRGARLKNNSAQGGQIMVTQDGIDAIRRLGAGAELDLRSDEETNSSYSALSRRGVKFKRIASANTCLGDKILDGDAYIEALETIIGWIKDDGVGVYISSSLGADRVGTLAFLINGLLGVSESDLAKDYELSSFSTDTLENVLRKRSDSQYSGMVTKIKSLPGETLQQKIYNYFKTGVNGTAISVDKLDWFIGYMLEERSPMLTKVVAVSKERITDNRIFNLFGQEVTEPGKGIYIRNGKKFIIR